MSKYTQANKLLRITTPFDDDYLLIDSMTVTEGISQLYNMEIEVLHEEKDGWTIPEVVDHKKLLGQDVHVQVTQDDGRTRYFNGMVIRLSQGSRGIRFTRYSITVVPNIWILTKNQQSRIFQQKTVRSILEEVFQDFENMIVWELDYDYKQRNYCVQYRETDFNFASRLMEEEGIYYYFEHKEEEVKLIISDKPRFTRDIPGKTDVTFTFAVTSEKFESHISEWETDYQLGTGQVSFRDHHIQQPNKSLAVTKATSFQVGNNNDWEIYDFPGGYARKFDGIGPSGDAKKSDLDNIMPDGTRAAQMAMEAIDAQFKTGSAASNCSTLTPGHKFKMVSHPIGDLNGEWVVTSITHSAFQSPPYEPDREKSIPYSNRFKALGHGREGAVPFRPPRTVEKPIVYGAQTATVVGAGDEEIYTDDYGRIKVQFFWDRDGKTDGLDSCWLPVAQPWAGNGWGSVFIPRVGMEVLVHFLEGNPDQPMVTGCVYTPMNMPPYKLPDEKTKSTIKTYSTKGGGGFNEFRFEDDKGHEQIFIHGEKDLDIRIKNDRREWTGNDQHLIVKNDLREGVEGNAHLKVGKTHFEEIGTDDHLKVGGKQAIKVGGTKSQDIGGDYNTSVSGSISKEAGQTVSISGMSVIVEAKTQLSLKVGGNFIDINSGGIFIQGTMVMINSGGMPGMATPAMLVPPTAPEKPDEADNAEPGKKIQLEKQSNERKKKKPKEDEKPKSWIDLKLVDEENNPVPGEGYEVVEADGTTHTGSLDQHGKAHVLLSKPGNCKVSFPRLDKGAWEEA